MVSSLLHWVESVPHIGYFIIQVLLEQLCYCYLGVNVTTVAIRLGSLYLKLKGNLNQADIHIFGLNS